MEPEITAETRVVALLGDPVRHSLSPVFQNAAFRAAGLDAVYVALRCGADEVPGLIRGIALAGGAGNVTLPHKGIAATVVDRPSEAVIQTGACNTWWSEEGVVCGDNTDVPGLTAAIESLLGRAPEGARVLLIGAGGSARAAVYALIGAGVDRITILNRSMNRARALRSAFPQAAPIAVASMPEDLSGEAFDLVINATSLGLQDEDPLPLSPHAGIEIGAALDLVYSPRLTPWILALRDRGIPATDGLEMLLQQGAAAFTRWWGTEAPIHAMRAALAGIAKR